MFWFCLLYLWISPSVLVMDWLLVDGDFSFILASSYCLGFWHASNFKIISFLAFVRGRFDWINFNFQTQFGCHYIILTLRKCWRCGKIIKIILHDIFLNYMELFFLIDCAIITQSFLGIIYLYLWNKFIMHNYNILTHFIFFVSNLLILIRITHHFCVQNTNKFKESLELVIPPILVQEYYKFDKDVEAWNLRKEEFYTQTHEYLSATEKEN